MLTIIRAQEKHLAAIVPLFDAYRVFYGQPSNLVLAKKFLVERFTKNESIIFSASYKDMTVGFLQLYPTFSSVTLQSSYILNDLYVAADHRKKGIGEALLNRAKKYCLEQGYKGLALETAIDNQAQLLYERLGWVKDTHCFHYFWPANNA
ncbi:MAG: GNAT family N-acetyltransferase [Maribacter sp.]|nr:GNAT family N-acetyltransferase [Maribacter sp.]